MVLSELKTQLSEILNQEITNVVSAPGSSTHETFCAETPTGKFFVKASSRTTSAFRHEATGLRHLAQSYPYVPEVVFQNEKLLITEFILAETPNGRFWQSLAEQLANMHQKKGDFFGFFENNCIGAAAQQNIGDGDLLQSWGNFFWHNRINYKLDELKASGQLTLSQSRAENLKTLCQDLLNGYDSHPGPLHGDLWSGNIMCGPGQKPYLIDPAFYFGDREADVAMTECFGGFPPQFYQAYQNAFPLEPGYQTRKHIYNLYHMLNHLLIFGASYRASVLSIISMVESQKHG